MDKKSEILAIISSIEGTTFSDVQSIQQLLEYGFKLSGWVAFTGEAMSEAKELLHNARRQGYLKVEGSLLAHERKWSISLMKDYVNDCCAKENAYYELCERCNRSAVHAIDLCRTALSCLREEMRQMNFQSTMQ